VSNPITPLDPDQLTEQESQAAHEGWLHRSLVSFDQMVNVIVLRGLPDETISSHAARAAQQGKHWGIGLSRVLNLFQRDHGAKAEAGDLQRATNVVTTEGDAVIRHPQFPSLRLYGYDANGVPIWTSDAEHKLSDIKEK
jgi:hypothetical protein